MRTTTKYISIGVLALALVIAPFVISNAFYLDLLIRIAMNAIVVLGLNLLIGFAGQISMGHAGFLGIGAYASAILPTHFGWHPLLAMLATSYNRLAAELVGINTSWVLFMSFVMAAALGALGGILVTPITLTSYDVGIMLGLKGFVAAVVGGLGNGLGAVFSGLLVGVLESMGAGYISSAYKDAIPFILILLVLFFMPRGLFGGKSTDRV